MLPSVAMIVIEVVCAALIVPVCGVKANQFGVPEATVLNASVADVRLEIVKACDFSVAPGVPRNSSPLGVTAGGAAVPAGTMCNTIAMVMGGCVPSVGVRITAP